MKTYVKPELYYESFELSQHIAACDLRLGSSDVTTCAIEQDNKFGTLAGGFLDAPKTCSFYYEQYCYTNGAGMPSTFTS